MYARFLLLTVCLCSLQTIFSQTTISGKVTEQSGAPNGYAVICLFKYGGTDSVQVAGVSADDNGQFAFSQIANGTYRVKAALVGFNDMISPVIQVEKAQPIALGALVMTPVAALKEVVISSTKRMIEVQVDKTVINVEGSALATGNTVLEILQRSPGVVVTPQEQINLAGKGEANILIDGKPLQLSGDERVAFLRSLTSDAVKSIELIANPSAKYDAEGTAGIINIRLKKNQNFGVKGSASLGYSQSIHHRLNGGLNLNYRPGGVNFFLNTNVSDAAQTVEQKIDRFQNGKYFDEKNPETAKWNTQFVKTGADWFINDFHTAGFMVTGSRYDHTTRGFSNNRISDLTGASPDSVLTSQSVHPEYNQRLNYNFNYRFADTLGHEWSFDADRINYQDNGSNTIENRFFNNENTLAQSDISRSDLLQDIGIWSLKSDYAITKKSGWKVESGAKITFTKTNNDITGSNNKGTGFQPDAGRTNQFNLHEVITAAYTNVQKSMDKWSFQAGLRAENTQIKGISTDISGQTIQNPDTSYTSLFPSVFVQYQIAQEHQIGISCNRRLERPAYQDLNPFIWQTGPYTSERGNPWLRPAYSQSAELKYTYKYAASIAVSYTQTTGIIQTVARTSGDQVWLQPFNIAGNKNFSINISAPTPIAKWWEGYCWLGVSHNSFSSTIDNNQLRTSSWGGSFWTGQQFKLGRGYGADISVWGQFPTTEGVFRNKGIASLDLGFKKTFLDGKATLKLAVYDVLGTQHWQQSVNFGGLQATRRNDWESQAVALRLNWNFGNEKVKTRDRNDSDAAGRIKPGKNQ